MTANRINYARQEIDQSDIEAVVQALQSDLLTQGPRIVEFEQSVANRCGGALATAVNSATSALHVACMALGLGPGDVLWTSPNTFVASANCALYCGASVDFVDVDPVTYNMSVGALAAKLATAEKNGSLPRIVVPVHFAGQPCDMEQIAALAKRYRFSVVEDASHAIGAQYKGEPVGNCRWSDIAIFSFHPVKIITTAEGGMLLTQNRDLHKRIQLLRSHGITRDAALMTNQSHGPWYYEQVALGYNYRITDVQAALGLSQLKRIDSFIERRRCIAARYDRELADLPLVFPQQAAYGNSAWHLYVVQIDSTKTPMTRTDFYHALYAAGIIVNVHYIPVHTQPYYQKLGFKWGDFPVAEAYYRHVVSLPMYAGLSEEEQTRVINVVRKILS